MKIRYLLTFLKNLPKKYENDRMQFANNTRVTRLVSDLKNLAKLYSW